MLLRQHPGRQRVGRVVSQHGDDRLIEDRAVVEFGGDVVHCGSSHAAARFDGATVRACSKRILGAMQNREDRIMPVRVMGYEASGVSGV